ncbi:MFS transporter [Frondihabitans peucedani]|uniref:MFS transporter n=2 Tax=Frondihabitans peucedani TaxID=598626 RepID=A0ABP8DX48_9MICO
MLVYAGTLLVMVASGAAPSPLYPVYQAEWGFSPLFLTVVFAVYVLGLLVTLLTAGAISDFIGRRPVVLVALAVSITSMLVFAFASAPMMLIVARVVQGLAIGLATGALGAAMIDHQPARRPIAPFLNGVVPPIALSVGALGSGLLVQFVAGPEQTVFFVLAGLMVVAGVGVALTRERIDPRPGALRSLTPVIRIPQASKALFAGVIGCMIASWALGGMYLAFSGSVLSAAFGIHSPLAAGAMIFLFAGTGAATGIVIQKRDARRSMLVGVVALIVGPIGTVAALWTDSLPLLIVSSVVAGVGFGAGFQAGLRLLLATAPADERAGLLSSVYVASYLAFGVPTVVAGVFVPTAGLTLVLTVYAAFVVASAVTALILQRVLASPRRAELRADRLA